jgi:hypothetical protein
MLSHVIQTGRHQKTGWSRFGIRIATPVVGNGRFVGNIRRLGERIAQGGWLQDTVVIGGRADTGRTATNQRRA